MSDSGESSLDKEDFKQALIEHVFSHPILYDPDHEESKHQQKRDLTWAGIASELGETEDVVKKRWKNMRDTYVKSLRTNKKNMEDGTKSHKPNNRSWYLAKKMARFKPFISPPETPSVHKKRNLRRNNEDKAEVKIDIHDFLEANFDDVEVPEGKSKKLRTNRSQTTYGNSGQQTIELIEVPETSRVSQIHLPKDDNAMDDVDYLMLGYAKTIKKFSPRGQASVKLKIAMLINEQETKELDDQNY